MEFHCCNCPFNDGLVYTSFPAKYKCKITNEYNLAYHSCGKVKICYIDFDNEGSTIIYEASVSRRTI